MEKIMSEKASQAADVVADASSKVNVGSKERLASTVAGSALALWGVQRALSKGTWTGWLLAAAGGMLIHRGTTGHCQGYQALGVDTSSDEEVKPAAPPVKVPDAVKDAASSVKVPDVVKDAASSAKEAASSAKEAVKNTVETVVDAAKGATADKLSAAVHVERAVTIQKPAQELFDFWRNFENLPQFMGHLEEVRVHDDKRSMWIATGPAGAHIEWEAEITDETPGELIAWKSLPDADVPNIGSVQFKDLGDDHGTEVKVTMEYSPLGGVLGAIFAQLWGEEPSQQVDEDLHRFKSLMETGEVATIDG
jgi:uncharacterized membrane protein